VLTVSETSAELIREWLADDRIEVRNAGNGCSDIFFHESASTREPGRYLYVGNLKKHKNVDVMLKALAIRPNVMLTAVVGDEAAARQIFSSAGLMSRVQVLSKVSDAELVGLYRRSAALLMPSTLEGFGLPAAEALAAGTPVCFWKGCASVAEIVGQSGIAVEDAHDPEEWAAAIDRVDSLRLNTLERTRVQNSYSWSAVAQKVQEHLYETS
jgi:glycosyltransferase involved in cell wall biosynthesis